MTTPERSVEEIVEEFNSTFPGCDQCQYGNGQGDWIEHWLTQTLQTERQRCEEMVDAITNQLYGMNLNITFKEQENMFKEIGYVVNKFITHPNNPK